ncbi:hypothetical protein ACS126_03485 [Sphingobacterium lactis]|uniref:hypothetical protein n=1 Tax=Sphingobacterium TaxID=28453 RepID=UPI000EE964C2|nr:hypothetical protein [Sphingobacterium hotanense]MCT1526766.1 hypothetical protein [Sphingobacterium hotanense]HAP95939.1 hypothetical protein [Chryseobacterium sp.]
MQTASGSLWIPYDTAVALCSDSRMGRGNPTGKSVQDKERVTTTARHFGQGLSEQHTAGIPWAGQSLPSFMGTGTTPVANQKEKEKQEIE